MAPDGNFDADSIFNLETQTRRASFIPQCLYRLIETQRP